MTGVRKAIIVGGGPGGLATARALHAIGMEVVVIERGDDHAAGAGITLWPNATHALDRLNLLPAMHRQSVEISAMAIRTHRDRLLFGLELSSGAVAFGGYPSLVLTRTSLLDCLRDRLEPKVVQSSPVSSCVVENGTVVVRLCSGREIEADYLVGADGERSIVRQQLFGPASRRHAGYVVWRGVAPIQPYGATGISWLGKAVQFGTFPLPQHQTYWFAMALASSVSSPMTVDRNAQVGALFGDWPAPIREIIAATSPGRIILTDCFLYPQLPYSVRGRVALVGDAAHPIEPTLGQGACLAFEDAVVLAQSLSTYPDIDQAGAHYAVSRFKRAHGLATRAHVFGLVSKWKSGLSCSIRNLMIAATPTMLHRKQIASMFAWSPGPLADHEEPKLTPN